MPDNPAANSDEEKHVDKDALLKQALREFHVADEAESEFRREFVESLKFRTGDQWPANVRTARDYEQKPCLTIDKTSPAIRQVVNDMRQNTPQLRISATDDSKMDTASKLEGLVRYIQVSNNADIAVDTAGESAVGEGLGYFRVLTEYEDEKSFDQEIKIKRIKNTLTVYVDPYAIEPDYSDARFYFVVDDMSREEFKEKYPDAEVSNADFASVEESHRTWLGQDTIRIAEYWRVEEQPTMLYLLENGQRMLEDEYEDLQTAIELPSHPEAVPIITKHLKAGNIRIENGQHVTPAVKKTRETTIRKVMCYKITAYDILEQYEWPGKYIPIIPVIGEDHEVQGKRLLRGMTYRMMDPQRQYNYWTTAATEAIALAPKAPWLATPNQIKDFELIWANANKGAPSYLPYNPDVIPGVGLVPAPQRITAEPPIAAMAAAIQQASGDLKAVSGVFDPSLGNRPSGDTSGKAILALQKKGDVANFHFMDNLTRSMRFLGVILLDLIPKIYDAARIVKILHEDNTQDYLKINQPTGKKVRGASGQETDEFHDFTDGKYDIVMETGPSYMTKREETASQMLELARAYPSLLEKAGYILVRNLDWNEAQEISEQLKRTMPPEFQPPPEDGTPPTQLETQQSSMIKQLTAALHTAMQEVETKQLERESKERINMERNLAEIVKAVITTESANNQALLQAELQHISDRFSVLHDGAMVGLTQAQETQGAAQQSSAPPPQGPGG